MLENLTSLQWKNRIIVMHEVDDQAAVLCMLKRADEEINERHIIWFVISGHDVLSNYPGQLSERFVDNARQQFQLGQSKVILIGKDGGLKSSFADINLNAIFSDIDAMPMRQSEVKQ